MVEQSLKLVEQEITALKGMSVEIAPQADLFLFIREIPGWKIQVVVHRRPITLGTLAGISAACATLALNWSDPLSYTLAIRGAHQVVRADQTLTFFRGMTVSSGEGQTIQMRLSAAQGAVDLANGPLIVRDAGIRRISGLPYIVLELPRGDVSISFAGWLPHDCRIVTPQSVIRLAGTSVRICSFDGVTQLSVASGSAEVMDILTGEQAMVFAGKTAQISCSGILTRKTMTEAQKAGADSAPDTQKSRHAQQATDGSAQNKAGSSLWYEVK